MGMGGGSSSGTTVTQPWAGAAPYLSNVLSQAATNYQGGGPAYYPGQSFVGPTPGQISGWDTQLNYADQVFGGQQAPQFGQATGALGNALTGNTDLGALSSGLSPLAGGTLSQSFASPFGTAGGLDARGAISGALSGTPDYTAVGNAVGAANQQQFNQLYSDVIPQLNQRASFLGNPSGSIKTLNSTLSNLTNNQNLNAQQAYLGEYNRAKAAQEGAAQLVSQGGLSSQSNALGLGGLAGNLATGQNDAALRGVALFPSIAQTGAVPGQLASSFGDWGAGFQNQALQDQINRYNYYQNEPLSNLQNYSALVNGYGGLGQTSSTTPSSSQKAGSALGGALAGAQLGTQVYPGWGTVIGGIGGAALGYFSDRRLKTGIARVGKLPSGLNLYSFRYHGSPTRHIGVMADEAREKFPYAVTRGLDGFDRVNYAMVA
jgi:Chaperone of endosialidase